MRVKELIAELQKYDPEMEVMCADPEYGVYNEPTLTIDLVEDTSRVS